MLDIVTAIVGKLHPGDASFFEWSGGVRDGTGQAVSLPSAERTCEQSGCMWWKVRDSVGEGGVFTELCGRRRIESTRTQPATGFAVCYWMVIDRNEPKWRLLDYVVKSIT